MELQYCSNKKQKGMQMNKSQTSLGFEHLPHGTLFEIIVRLPFSSLGRLKCTCKLWNDYLKDSTVIDLHLRQSSQNLGFICANGLKVYYVGGEAHAKTVYYDGGEISWAVGRGPSSDNIEEIKPFHVSKGEAYPFNCRPFPYDQHSGSAGGLFAYYVPPPENTFYICNPVTREHVKLPPQNPQFPYELGWGFGYSSSLKDYKLVRFGYGGAGVETSITSLGYSCFHRETISSMEKKFHGVKPNPIFFGAMYSLKSNSWGELEHVPFPPWGLHLDLNGSLFWLIWNLFYEGEEMIMSFNIDTQKFKALPGPPVEIHATTLHTLMNIGGDTLAFVEGHGMCRIKKIWVLMDHEKGVWVCKDKIIMDNGWKAAPWGILWNAHLMSRLSNCRQFSRSGSKRALFSCSNYARYPLFESISKQMKLEARRLLCYYLVAIPHAGSLVSPRQIAGI
ncbi:hypothetical protein COLO4_11180 [Corchorus olitorius]|uniref:F-box domain-containing protein n=1 Tax=Corchorus olitorius TaxID=93759 RepID=A0A1R3K5L0_9ROSI|nr:hypothetical protein COLO4_11180 [Corchorus olitorius]